MKGFSFFVFYYDQVCLYNPYFISQIIAQILYTRDVDKQSFNC